MDLARDGNLIEAIVWFVLAFVVGIYSFIAERRFRRTLFLLALTLAVFGGSDFVEARTGAWWKPWWLFVWKALCVAGLLACFIHYFRLAKKGPRPDSDSERE